MNAYNLWLSDWNVKGRLLGLERRMRSESWPPEMRGMYLQNLKNLLSHCELENAASEHVFIKFLLAKRSKNVKTLFGLTSTAGLSWLSIEAEKAGADRKELNEQKGKGREGLINNFLCPLTKYVGNRFKLVANRQLCLRALRLNKCRRKSTARAHTATTIALLTARLTQPEILVGMNGGVENGILKRFLELASSSIGRTSQS